MADAQDFIPKEAEIEVREAYFIEDVKNLASDDDIVGKVKASVDEYDNRFVAQREQWTTQESGIWNLCDWAFRSCINDAVAQSEKSKGANEPDTWERAKTGTTQFHRQVTQKASNGYAVQTSRDMPFKYEALQDDAIDSTQDHTKQREKKLNLLAKWSMKRDKFNRKSNEFWTQINKYGNTPVMVEWIQELGEKTISVPQFDTDGITVVDTKIEKVETVVENRPVLKILPIEAVKADTAIGNIQDQECVIVSGVVGMSDIVDGIQTGIYREDLLEDLNTNHQWDGFSGFENEFTKKENRALVNKPTNTGTGQYLKREVFINVPIDDNEETWDELANVPLRYRVTMFGNTANESVVARIERNQEPDDAIPIEMIHANPDDQDLLYHISSFEVVRSNIATETTLIRQIIDNNTLVNKPPLWEVQGSVRGNDREFKPDQRFIVDDQNSIGEFKVRDVSQPSIQVLEYLKEDSNTANSIDKNMTGESFGARTSASEANTISGNSRRPNLVNIEYILDQFLGFYAWRIKVLWEAYGRREQVVQITDEEDRTVQIKPKEIGGEFDIIVDIMDDIKDDAAQATRMTNYATVIATTPMAETVDWVEFNKVLSEKMMGTSKFVRSGNEGDAEANARANVARILNQGTLPQLTDSMNLKKHLEIYKAERMRWSGNEDQNENIGILDQVIAQVEGRISSPPQQNNLTAPVSEGIQGGQQISEALGGIQ